MVSYGESAGAEKSLFYAPCPYRSRFQIWGIPTEEEEATASRPIQGVWTGIQECRVGDYCTVVCAGKGKAEGGIYAMSQSEKWFFSGFGLAWRRGVAPCHHA